ncbi:MAG: type II toxin-antitoxin system HicA family toxin [Microcystis sp. M53603_WE2]|jgi:predicted RNA binding protein YcfA (HicA-like mRNA interferase family)|uniref:type II toxin-antitoxin system HicA family toxin n=1 Tax=Microcystis sp. M53603_WE2 TaxID=3030678 RepID=UPI0025853AA4|nr:type II toxin-antitoxin system HicA family toxin [Microcystis sp. M53603_WE2]MDJ0527334.1 type II toxin-antitoxin system HicA family toxin [Microcystis sp. M53600_WE12]MDJ0539284.1 type II toxin-antitoxin system HicA family toxin [Microcystis sp. M53603_WE2]MDJ0543067.1 type II toxin-antitoxin system HicA family toxin [Microcystis sp. M53601_WE4]MDJ0566003.1 type II toxin-antitoxin system HicA family toxin [Microcystis sp. M49629_WE12]
MESREIIKKPKDEGWYQVGTTGSHHHFKHPHKKGKVTVPHPKKDIPLKTLISIEKQASIKLR